MILVDDILGLFLNIKTYKKNISKLFDYCSKEIKEINTFIENTTFLTRKDDQYLRLDKQSDLESKKGEELIFYIRKNKNEEFTFENPVPFKNITFNLDNINNLNNKIWYVLNSNNPNICQNEDYYLCQDDIIRMGNVKLIVKEVHIKNEKEFDEIEISNPMKYNINLLNENTGTIFNFCPQIKKYILFSEDSKNNKIKCNFCKKHECDKDNPLICFCSCNDYYFHFLCLKDRIQKKTKIKQNSSKTINNYYIKGEVSCQKCNLNYPLKFQIEGIEKFYEFISIDTPKEGNYLILESIENKLYYGSMKFIFVIGLNEKVIKIGRGKANDVDICDPSISKRQAEIKYEKGKIFLKNISEKYGTLILVKKSIKINDNIITLQVGRSVIQAKQMKYGEFRKLELNNKHYPLSKKD